MMRMRWMRGVISVSVLAVAGLVTFSVSSGTEVATPPERSAPGVRVETIERGGWRRGA